MTDPLGEQQLVALELGELAAALERVADELDDVEMYGLEYRGLDTWERWAAARRFRRLAELARSTAAARGR